MQYRYSLEEIGRDWFVHRSDDGQVGILRCGDRAVLINAVHPGLAACLAELGIRQVDNVLFTHHRRELADGLPELLEAFSPEVMVPEEERGLFEIPEEYWGRLSTRWRLLCGHVPYHATHVRPLPVAGAVADGEAISWEGFVIHVKKTPGYTDGAVSYVVEREGLRMAFCGDLIYAPGRVRDIYSLQHAEVRNGHRVGDYHGFLGAMPALLESLDALVAEGIEALVPAHGMVIRQPAAAVALLRARFRAFYHAYAGISALRWYFPDYFALEAVDAKTLPMQPTAPLPENVRILAGTTWALIADNGRALLIDPYSPASVEAAAAAVEDGTIAGYDAIWLTHYHHDHVEAAEKARLRFDIPVITDRVMADVVAHPERYFLTCLSPEAVEVSRPTRDGATWRWQDMTLTAYHFPGQTYYHSGLFVRPDAGPTLFFAGDAVTPTGIDDYCSWNRNWLGRGVGFDRCLRLLRSLSPDLIFNQHVNVGFSFTAEAYELMLDNLEARQHLLGDMLPDGNPNFGADEAWLSTYPYEQSVERGTTARLELVVMNHADHACDIEAELIGGESCGVAARPLAACCEAGRESRLAFALEVRADAVPGRHVLPVRVIFDGRQLGTLREAIVAIR